MLLPAITTLPAISKEATPDTIGAIEAQPLSELWLNAGFYSYHFESNKNLNDNNIGVGVEYRYSSVNAVTAGRYQNSDRLISNFAAWCWQPYTLGGLRLGALLGMLNGYPKANDGDWFPVVLPVVSYEYNNLGFNLTAVPTYRDILHGSLSLQLKLKLF